MDPQSAEYEERRRLGLDRRDEMWDGVLHMNPLPRERHGRFATEFAVAIHGLAKERGLRVASEIGMFKADVDFRVPDLLVYRPDQVSRRGIEFPTEMVIEVESPRDESRKKLPWYIANGVREVLLISRDTLAVELYVADNEGRPKRVEPPHSSVLGCAFERVGDNHLRLLTDAGAHEIVL